MAVFPIIRSIIPSIFPMFFSLHFDKRCHSFYELICPLAT